MSFQDPSGLIFCFLSFSGLPVVDACDMLPQNPRMHFLFLPAQSVPHGLRYCSTLTIPADMYKLGFYQYVICNLLNIPPTSWLFCFYTVTPPPSFFLTYAHSYSRHWTPCRWGKCVTPLCEQFRSIVWNKVLFWSIVFKMTANRFPMWAAWDVVSVGFRIQLRNTLIHCIR
jgi:hypothetical protein